MRTLRSLFFLIPILLTFLFLFQTTAAIDGVRRGLALFLESVFPALFPFLVLSELILSCGGEHRLVSFPSRPLSRLFGISKAAADALWLGMLCGQPIAGSSAIALFEKGVLTKSEVKRISLFGNNPSSGFLIAAVGGALFASTSVGVALFCITWLSAVLLGIFLRLFFGKAPQSEEKYQNGMSDRPFSALFTQAVQRGFSAVLQIGAFLIFFSALSGTLVALLSHTSLNVKWHALILGALEITSGIHAAIATLSAYSALRLTAFLCGFGGICVCMQILSITQKCGIPLSHYLLAKLLQGGIALLLCEGYLRLFKPVLSPASSIPTGTFAMRLPVLAFLLTLMFIGIILKHSSKRPGYKNKAQRS